METDTTNQNNTELLVNQSLPSQSPPAYSNSTPLQQQNYPPTQPQYQPQPQPHTTVVTTQSTVSSTPSGLRTAIPELPIVLAIILCIVNFILPGIGTVIAGFSVLCCGNVGQSGGGRFGTFCINFWIGLLQLGLTFFLVGWIWSVIWGVAFVAIATEAENRGATRTTTATTTTAVV